jgi:hypothetical protein
MVVYHRAHPAHPAPVAGHETHRTHAVARRRGPDEAQSLRPNGPASGAAGFGTAETARVAAWLHVWRAFCLGNDTPAAEVAG